MEVPGQVGPLLLHMIKSDAASRARAYCVSRLAAPRRYEQLAEVVKLQDGPPRLAAAFALGGARTSGCGPRLVEARRLSAVSLRTVAIQKLSEYTGGQHFAYRAQGSAADRERAAARWNEWWNAAGADFVRQSIKNAAPGAQGALVTAEEAERALQLWN